jgi:broad specificity phosphatase PhoE
MTVYVIASPPNKLDKKGRPSGWKNIPLDKQAKSDWRETLKQLTAGREIERVISSDLDSEAAHVAGSELRLPVRTDYIYRRFNIGRFHARNADAVVGALRAVEKTWESKPDVPIREGDSLTSFRKRFVRAFNELLEQDGAVLFVTDKQTIAMIRDQFHPHSLIPNGNGVRTDRLFKVQRAGTS